jgi:hypothetical protein
LNQAVQAHQSGRLLEAEALYREIIAQDPKNFDGLHLPGIVCSGAGKIQEVPLQDCLALTTGAVGIARPVVETVSCNRSTAPKNQRQFAAVGRTLGKRTAKFMAAMRSCGTISRAF